jgi:Clathrin adaptor complex small chain
MVTNGIICRGAAAEMVTSAFLLLQFKANKVVYRRYAGLFFAMCIDVTDNELAYLVSYSHGQASCSP